MKKGYWQPGMNKDVVKFVQKRLTCQQAKAEPQRSAGILQLFRDPEEGIRAKHDRVYFRTAKEPNKPRRNVGDY